MHFSIFSLIKNNTVNNIEKIYITASGGPFINLPINKFNKIENPVLSNININFDKYSDYYPRPIKDLYFNEPLMIFCKANSSFNEIIFEGQTSNGKFNKRFDLNKI